VTYHCVWTKLPLGNRLRCNSFIHHLYSPRFHDGRDGGNNLLPRKLSFESLSALDISDFLAHVSGVAPLDLISRGPLGEPESRWSETERGCMPAPIEIDSVTQQPGRR